MENTLFVNSCVMEASRTILLAKLGGRSACGLLTGKNPGWLYPFLALTGVTSAAARIMPVLDMARPIRRHIGTVTQDGRLFEGDVHTNIAINAPGLTEEQAREAAEMAGIADDIRRLPLGMNTVMSEGSGTFARGSRAASVAFPPAIC